MPTIYHPERPPYRFRQPQHATIYYTVYGDEQEQASTKAALESAKGILRSEVGKNITPTLTFVPDEVPVNAAHIEDLLRKTKAKDAELAAAREGAEYAGGADAYKTSETDEAE